MQQGRVPNRESAQYWLMEMGADVNLRHRDEHFHFGSLSHWLTDYRFEAGAGGTGCG
jgi:hypothetical protein